MLKDFSGLNPKGHVKLELYNEKEGVFFTKEKHNLVVLDANKIVANLMADPSRKNRISDSLVGNTEFNADGKAAISMPQHHEETKTIRINVSTLVTEIKLENEPRITKILSATADNEPLEVGTIVFIKDGSKGIIGFNGLGQKGEIVVAYQQIVNDMVNIINGTEKVTIASAPWERAATAVDSAKTYTVNYATGEIVFENPKTNVTINYDYEMNYALSFMGIGGLPVGHNKDTPVSYGRSDKFRTVVDNEFVGSRQPINFPLEVTQDSPEIDVLLAKNISTISRIGKQLEILDDGTGLAINHDYKLDITTVDGKRPIYEVTRAIILSGSTPGKDLLADSDFKVINKETGDVQVSAVAGLVAGDRIEVDYTLKAGTDHLTYQLNYSPVVKLQAVRYENNLGAIVSIPVDLNTKGMEFGTAGKVRVLNANAGTIEFAPSFEEQLASNPGKITVEYFVNSGTVVKFIADFPKGVPGPAIITAPDFVPDTSSGAVEYDAPYDLTNIKEVLLKGEPISAYSKNGKKITINEPLFEAGDALVVKYETETATHTIYTVGMFDHLDELSSNMFNISGIGPVTKDENTGMRITWSVTF